MHLLIPSRKNVLCWNQFLKTWVPSLLNRSSESPGPSSWWGLTECLLRIWLTAASQWVLKKQKFLNNRPAPQVISNAGPPNFFLKTFDPDKCAQITAARDRYQRQVSGGVGGQIWHCSAARHLHTGQLFSCLWVPDMSGRSCQVSS